MSSKKVLSADNPQGRLRIEPWYVSGFTDGEGSFHVALYRDPRMKSRIKIIPEFHVSQLDKSKKVLEELVEFFECGYLKENHRTNPKDKTFVYVVRDREDLLNKIIPFYEKYRLRTEKFGDFTTFAKIVRMMEKGLHNTDSGTKEIVSLAYTMNGGGRYRRVKLNDLFLKPSETIRRTPIEVSFKAKLKRKKI